MARYTCSLIVSVPIDHLQELLIRLLQECGLEIQYYTPDYIMAREIPGQVSFSKLVTVEVLIEKSSSTDMETRMMVIMKNEELPLQLNNHCRQIFDFVRQTIEHSRNWHLIESISS
jgi:hypothetical protein